MRLVDQWRKIEETLPEEWVEARLLLRVADGSTASRATSLLAPATPGRRGNEVRFFCARRGAGPSPDLLRRLLARLDRERILGELELLGSEGAEESKGPERQTLAAAWDAALATLPADWSDVYAEIELTSTDHLERAALLLSPVNPARHGRVPAFRFRVARRFGYGASPGMTRRCFERLDENGIPGRLRILRALSATQPVGTQGPVWYVEGKSV